MFWSLPLWHRQTRRICKAIRAGSGPVKILLKVRNDPIFLEDWHRHHAAIVGAQNLIIADNMSDDPDMIAALRRLAKLSTVFRFAGFHNQLGDRAAFAPLWQALDDSCQWHIALDADERLAWIEDDLCITDDRLVPRLMAGAPETRAIPALLLDNVTGTKDRFVIPDHYPLDVHLLPCALWGKPAIAAGSPWPRGAPIHNIQFPPEAFAARHPPHLIQLHMCNLIPEQRLRANREKLVARQVCGANTPYQKIADMDLAGETRSVVLRCVRETRRLLAETQPKTAPPHMHIAPDGRLHFSTPEAGTRFREMQETAGGLLAERRPSPAKKA
jgi:hypothetical protein